jgi:RNA polymerase sigma-70 factor, ECF subfamily
VALTLRLLCGLCTAEVAAAFLTSEPTMAARITRAKKKINAERALDLARMLHLLLPDEPGVAGLLALILFTDARRHTRTDTDGRLLPLAEQDHAQWDHAEITEGLNLLHGALRHRRPGRYVLMAAIAATHATAPRFDDTNWRQIVAL